MRTKAVPIGSVRARPRKYAKNADSNAQIIAKILLLHETFDFYFHINFKSMKTILINEVNSLKTYGSSIRLSRSCKLAKSIAHFKPKKTLQFQRVSMRSCRSNLSFCSPRWTVGGASTQKQHICRYFAAFRRLNICTKCMETKRRFFFMTSVKQARSRVRSYVCFAG